MNTYYIDEYIMGWEVVMRSYPSKLRWPVSHGPFRAEEEALIWAIQNLESTSFEGV